MRIFSSSILSIVLLVMGNGLACAKNDMLLTPKAEAGMVNIKKNDQKDILILHAYHPKFLWTSGISQGLFKGLANRKDIGEVFEEYMDTKRYSDTAYFHQLYQLYKRKYAHRSLDLIIVSDDHAFNFARKFRHRLFDNVPIVFCGINYMDKLQATNQEGITGVLELADIDGTLNALLQIYPETEKILVINDRSATGKQYHRLLNISLPLLDKPMSFEFTYDLTMEQILKKVSNLDAKTGVFFMTLIRDGNNQRYLPAESARMISQASSRPVFGLIQGHIKNGMVGGSIIYGDDHARMAAGLAGRILDGESPNNIPIVEDNQHHLIFSYSALKRHQIPTDLLPPGSTLVGAPTSIYYQHKWKILLILVIVCLLLLLVVAQQYRSKREAKDRHMFEIEAHIDDMTGTINRNYFEQEAASLLDKCRSEDKKLTLCYADINRLKFVNDTFGHHEGDRYIIAMVGLLRSAIRSSDLIYRMGGDEFVIIFKDCDIAQASERIRSVTQELTRLNHQVSAGNIKYSENYPRGISFGLAVFDPENPKNPNQLLEEADYQMYIDKKA